jgi:uncharacterized membrane protein YqiK
VIGIIAVVVVVGIVVWFVRKRMGGADDRQSLLNRETGYYTAVRDNVGRGWEELMIGSHC